MAVKLEVGGEEGLERPGGLGVAPIRRPQRIQGAGSDGFLGGEGFPQGAGLTGFGMALDHDDSAVGAGKAFDCAA